MDSGDRIIREVVFLNIKYSRIYVVSADVLLAAFFIESSVSLVYLPPKTDLPVTPSDFFYFQRPKFIF
jgi:hypothetical protein